MERHSVKCSYQQQGGRWYEDRKRRIRTDRYQRVHASLLWWFRKIPGRSIEGSGGINCGSAIATCMMKRGRQGCFGERVAKSKFCFIAVKLMDFAILIITGKLSGNSVLWWSRSVRWKTKKGSCWNRQSITGTMLWSGQKQIVSKERKWSVSGRGGSLYRFCGKAENSRSRRRCRL